LAKERHKRFHKRGVVVILENPGRRQRRGDLNKKPIIISVVIIVLISTTLATIGVLIALGVSRKSTKTESSNFVCQIYVADDITCPLITGPIPGFIPPVHKVNPASRVTDGDYIWTVDPTGFHWTKTLQSNPRGRWKR